MLNYLKEKKREIKKQVKKLELEPMEIAVLKVMHSRSVYGGHHKQLETVMKSGFPKHELKNVKNAIYSLIKKGYVRWYHRADESIQLNKDRYQEIGEIIKKSIENELN